MLFFRPPLLVCDSICSRSWGRFGRFDTFEPIELGNFYCVNQLYGGVDEAWFHQMTVAIGAQGTKALLGVCSAQEHVPNADAAGLTHNLLQIEAAVEVRFDMTYDCYGSFTVKVRQTF